VDEGRRVWYSLALVGASLVVLFVLPSSYFIAATFAATSLMIIGAYICGGFASLGRPKALSLAGGLVSAAILYGVFFAGNAAVGSLQRPGVGAASEKAIYSLIASPSNPLGLQVSVLLFDAVGYESFFRGVLQRKLEPRLGVAAAPAVALLDAGMHIATFNPLWVATTFVADLLWGLTYRYGGGLQASMTSHFVWDIAIFIVRPIV
jgi:uncharacterized protein